MDRWYLKHLTAIIGLSLILVAVLIYLVEFLQEPVTALFYPFLLGSSEGKSVLFLILTGSLLLLNGVIPLPKITGKFADMDIWDSKRYLKCTIILVLITFVVGIFIEIYLRLGFGVSLFTVFVSLNPDVSSTSIIHSHVFKSALGSLLNTVGVVLPSNIHTGDSLSRYISTAAYLIILTLPLTYITSLISMDNRMVQYKVIIALAASLAMIGMIDGGIFSNPAIAGFGGLLAMFFIDEPFSLQNFIRPAIIVMVIIAAGISIEVAGSTTDYQELTLIDQTAPVNWNGYDILGENGTIKLNSTRDDRTNLISLFDTLKGKTNAFFITWNFYSYF